MSTVRLPENCASTPISISTPKASRHIWNPLSGEASSSNAVPVGLFNSGANLVYRAFVNGIILPSHDADEIVRVPGGEEDLVPGYYRTSPFSRAWMQLVKIESRPIDFFGKFSFAEAPPLPNSPDEVLNRFRNKVIKTADELRGMDTTIWRVRARKQSDLNEEVILTTGFLSNPISRESRDLQAPTILHITDPHYALLPHRQKHVWSLETQSPRGKPTLAEAIQAALNTRKIGLLLITGDFSFTGRKDEFEEAAFSLAFSIWTKTG